jgi:hypothetical protein
MISLPNGDASTTFQDVCFVCHRQNPSCCRIAQGLNIKLMLVRMFSTLPIVRAALAGALGWQADAPGAQAHRKHPKAYKTRYMFGGYGDVAHASCLGDRYPVRCIEKNLSTKRLCGSEVSKPTPTRHVHVLLRRSTRSSRKRARSLFRTREGQARGRGEACS